ncbi:MAG TPA: RDD family protein, partial [Thermoanaerobaculaceae bacterium]|nr:RDD family protein [Thermoanaerobaculaceae bacterium]
VQIDAPGLPREVRDAVEAGDVERAAMAVEKINLLVAFGLGPHHEELAPGTVRIALERLIPKTLQGVCLFGLAAVYFTLLHTGRRGATLGKRVMGIRVTRLDGHRLSIPEGFERFAGYLHIPGSLGLSLLDLWHDPNRRLPHDRVAHTAVLRVRPPATVPKPTAEAAPATPPAGEATPEA